MAAVPLLVVLDLGDLVALQFVNSCWMGTGTHRRQCYYPLLSAKQRLRLSANQRWELSRVATLIRMVTR